MVVTEEIVKCWCVVIDQSLTTGTLPKGYGHHPLCERCAIRTDESYPHFWDQNEIVELIDLPEYECYKDFKDELGWNILKGMCINTKHSMSIMEKVFKYDGMRFQ